LGLEVPGLLKHLDETSWRSRRIYDAVNVLERSKAVKDAFKRGNPCPSTGKTNGAFPGYVVDHINALGSIGIFCASNRYQCFRSAAGRLESALAHLVRNQYWVGGTREQQPSQRNRIAASEAAHPSHIFEVGLRGGLHLNCVDA